MKKITTILLLIIFIIPLCSCSPENAVTEQFFAMDTVMSITCYGDSSEANISAAKEEICRLDALLDAQDSASELSAFNRGESVSEETAELIRSAAELCRLTDGNLDITLRPASLTWGFGNDTYSVPTAADLTALKDIIGWEKLKEYSTLPDGMSVDLGAVAKGYASDRTAEILKNRGVASAILSLGGNIRVIGSKPDGSAYSVGIQDPEDPDKLAMSISVSDTSVITSGSYQRYFEEAGIRYHHILDPDTLSPSESGLISVSVICESGLYADALSTALFVMGAEEAADFYRKHQDFEMIMIDEDANVYYTEGISPKDLSEGAYQYHIITKKP